MIGVVRWIGRDSQFGDVDGVACGDVVVIGGVDIDHDVVAGVVVVVVVRFICVGSYVIHVGIVVMCGAADVIMNSCCVGIVCTSVVGVAVCLVLCCVWRCDYICCCRCVCR